MRLSMGAARQAVRRPLSAAAPRDTAWWSSLRACSTVSDASEGVETAASSSSAKPAAGAEAAGSAGAHARKVQLAVIGSGPSGCFVANYINKKMPDVHVDMYERLPVPFGLCRYGVAPDHPDVKNVEKQFLDMFKSGKTTWIGNVDVGKAIPIEALLEHYAGVILSTGAEGHRKLGIPGEDLGGVVNAKDFVQYYNTFPFPYGSPRFCPFDIERTHRVAVIGNGNVAIDVVRVLAGDYRYFCTTDMNCVALKELMKSRIAQIDVVARGDVTRSAFTIAEFRELTTYQETVKVRVDPFELEAALNMPADAVAKNPRAHKRLMDLVHQFCAEEAGVASTLASATAAAQLTLATPQQDTYIPPPPQEGESGSGPHTSAHRGGVGVANGVRGPCNVHFRYHLKPVRILRSAGRRNFVGGVLYERTDLPADASPKTRFCALPCDVVLTSIGSRASGIEGAPFDHKAGVIPNTQGRVTGMPRVYCSGWVKNGAKGVILHSVNDAQETVKAIEEDLATGVLPSAAKPLEEGGPTMFGKYGLVDYLVTKKMEPVSVAGLGRILHVEHERGVDLGKRAEKMDSVRDMLDVALGGEVGKRTDERVRGITPARPEAMMYLKELLDDETDLAPLAHELAREMPRKLAEEHPPGRIAPNQL